MKALLMILTPKTMKIVARRIHTDFVRIDAASSWRKDLQKFLSWSAYVSLVLKHRTFTTMASLVYRNGHTLAIFPGPGGKIRNHAQDPGCKNDRLITKRRSWNVCLAEIRKEVYHG